MCVSFVYIIGSEIPDCRYQSQVTHIFGRNDLLKFGQSELVLVLGQVLSEDLLQVLQVFRGQFGTTSVTRNRGRK